MQRRALRTVIVDDHELLAWHPRNPRRRRRFIVVGEAADADERAAGRRHEPDLVITDIRLPTANGIDLAGRLVDDHPGLMVVILSAYDDEHYVRAALAAGVSGYLLKTLPSHELVAALRHACYAGAGRIVSPRAVQGRRSTATGPQPTRRSPPREADVVGLVARGMSNKAIAHHLGISPRTVEGHPNHIFDKLGIEPRHPARPLRVGQPPTRTEHPRARPLRRRDRQTPRGPAHGGTDAGRGISVARSPWTDSRFLVTAISPFWRLSACGWP